MSIVIHTIFPLTHLEKFIATCSQLEFDRMLVPVPNEKKRMFYPYKYRDDFTKDCILELKERNNTDCARLFSTILAGWVARTITTLTQEHGIERFVLVPVPQHISKTREKGFCHTHTLAEHVYTKLKRYIPTQVALAPCIQKVCKTKKLHDLKNKKLRFATIKNTMHAFVTKVDAPRTCFFVLDDVYTTGATFKEARRSLLDCGTLPEHIYFIAIAH